MQKNSCIFWSFPPPLLLNHVFACRRPRCKGRHMLIQVKDRKGVWWGGVIDCTAEFSQLPTPVMMQRAYKCDPPTRICTPPRGRTLAQALPWRVPAFVTHLRRREPRGLQRSSVCGSSAWRSSGERGGSLLGREQTLCER